MTEWVCNDPDISPEDTLYRRVPKVPNCRTWDPLTETYRLNPGALQRDAGDGLSTHLHSILALRGRDPKTLYEATHGSVGFEVVVPRRVRAGVLKTEAVDEPDPDRAAAHADVRPPRPEKDRAFWKTVVNEIADAAYWVQQPD